MTPQVTQDHGEAAPKQYLILSVKHSGGYLCWWRPNGAGYTQCLDLAGRYSAAEIQSICGHPRSGEIPVPESEAAKLRIQKIVDLGWGDNFQIIEDAKDAWRKAKPETATEGRAG